jgi:transcription elongation factor Elf1
MDRASTEQKIKARGRRGAKPHTHVQELPRGSVIYWAERDPNNPWQVKVTCGGCGRPRFTKPQLGHKERPWTGFCRECGYYGMRKVDDEPLTTGSVIHWGERDPNNRKLAPVTCGGCGVKRVVRLPLYEDRREYTGFCVSCGHTQHFEDQPLPNGSIIHWTERHPDKPHKILMVTCGGCGLKRWTYHLSSDGETRGFCSPCAKRANIKNEYMREGKDEPLSSGSIVHWGERDPNDSERVMVTCGICGKKRMTKIQYKRLWTGFCFAHRSARGMIQVVSSFKQAKGDRRKNGGAEKKSGGRPPKSEEQKREDLKESLILIQREIQRWKKAGTQRGKVTANSVAESLHIGSAGRGGTAMMETAKNRGLAMDWPSLRDHFWDGGQISEVKINSPDS